MSQDEFVVFSFLKSNPTLNLLRISDRLSEDPRRLAKILDALEARGLIQNLSEEEGWEEYEAKSWIEIDEHEQKANAKRHICSEFSRNGKEKFWPADLVPAFHGELDEHFILNSILGELIIDGSVNGPPHKSETYILINNYTCSSPKNFAGYTTTIHYTDQSTTQQTIIGSSIAGDVSQSSSSFKTKVKAPTSTMKKIFIGIIVGLIVGYLVYLFGWNG